MTSISSGVLERAAAGSGTRIKVLVAGGSGAGKTTFVAAASEIPVLTTNVALTDGSTDAGGSADAGGRAEAGGRVVVATAETTAAMDFGRVTLHQGPQLLLFGTPGQQRFWFMWDRLARGAMGAVVLADVRHLERCFTALDYFDDRRVPYVVVVNRFPDTPTHDREEIREALSLAPDTPLVIAPATARADVLAVLRVLVEQVVAGRRVLRPRPAFREPAGHER